MLSTTLALLLLVSLSADESPQLLVADNSDSKSCRPAPGGWDSAEPFSTASAEMVRQDLDRYFGGLSAQFTQILPAAWHGTVRFCSGSDEAVVLDALVEWAVRSSGAAVQHGDELPIGAEQLLVALASSPLVERLESTDAMTEQESARLATALALVLEAAALEQAPGDGA